MTTRTTRVLADGYKFLEGPRWRDGELWMAEIGAGDVVATKPDGTPLVVSIRERRLMRTKGNELEHRQGV